MFVLRLVRDVVRRHRSLYVVLSVLMASSAIVFRLPVFAAVSMTMAFVLGIVADVSLRMREVAILPLSRRQLWQARWLLLVAVPPIVLLGPKLASRLAGAQGLTFDQIATLSLSECAFCGVIASLSGRLPLAPSDRPGWRQWAVAGAALTILAFGLSTPWFLRDLLPLGWMDLHGMTRLVVAIALLVTIADVFRRPRPTPRPGRPDLRRRRRTVPLFSGPGARFTGLPLLLWRQLRQAVMVMPAVLVGTVAYWTVAADGLGFSDFAIANRLLLLSAGDDLGLGVFNPMIVVFLASSGPLLEMGRQLRALRGLPISTTRLAMLLIAPRAFMVLAFWVLSAGGYLFVVGAAPESFRPGLFLFLLGASSVAGTLELVMPGPRHLAPPIGAVAAVVVIVVPSVILTGMVGDAGWAMVGAALLLASLLANRRILRRSTRIYRSVPHWKTFAVQPPQS